jgi:hypothetical protein
MTVSPRDGSVMGSLDLPDQPDEPRRAEQADPRRADRLTPRARDLPDPDERGRAYEAIRAHISAETPAEASPGEEPDAGDQRSYRDDGPRLQDIRADHDRRWPEEPHAAADRPGGRPELPPATAESAGQVREAGRTPSTAAAIEQENKSDGPLEARKHPLKGEDRPQEKISGETAEEASRDQPPDKADQRSYWDEMPRFRDMWADHERRWPERQHAAEPDRSTEPPGTYRSKGGLKLNPEQHAEANETIRRVRGTEQPISADMQTIGKENAHCGWLEGFEDRIKGDDRLKEKIAAVLKVEPRTPVAEALREVPDAIRYTCCFQSENYAMGYYDVKERIESRGYQMYYSHNYWTNAEYKGINTRWVTPGGQRFEVQFHTPESFHAKHDVTHIAYERIRDTTTSRTEKRELHEFQRQVCALIEAPEGATDIPSYRKKGF